MGSALSTLYTAQVTAFRVGFCPFLFLGAKRLPFTTKGIGFISKTCDLFNTFKSIFRLLVITTCEGVGADSVHEFDFSFDLLKEHIQNGRHIG